jgi:hypothetical protein
MGSALRSSWPQHVWLLSDVTRVINITELTNEARRSLPYPRLTNLIIRIPIQLLPNLDVLTQLIFWYVH